MAILDIDQAADFLKMSRRSLETLVRTGKVPATRLIDKWIFSDNQLQSFIEKLSTDNLNKNIDNYSEQKKTPPSRRRRNPAP